MLAIWNLVNCIAFVALPGSKVKRSLKLGELEALRADIDKGMADLVVEVSEATAIRQLARIHGQMKQLCRHPGIGARGMPPSSPSEAASTHEPGPGMT